MRSHAKAATAGSRKTRRAALPIGAFAAILAALALVAALASAAVPTATTGSASNIQKTTATLNGTVNPQGALLEECKFEWATESEWNSTFSYGQSQACNLTPAEIGEGTAPVAVNADITGLSVGTTYHFRLVAKNSEGTSNGSDQTFKTLSPPVVEAFASDVVYSEATINAAINPEGFATSYKLEWGPTTAYGSEIEDPNIGSDNTIHSFSRSLFSLAEGTTYHYRAVATNANGTTETPDHTFTTYAHEALDTSCPNQANRYGAGANLPDCRAYEMVSPVKKGGGDIVTRCNINCLRAEFQQASVDGEKLAYSSNTSFGDAVANLYTNQYLATRGASGWSSHGLSPAHEGEIFFPFNPSWDFDSQFRSFSDDLNRSWVTDDAEPPLTPDAVPGEVTLFRRDNLTDAWHPAWTSPPTSGNPELGRFMTVEGNSADGAHSLFGIRGAFTPNAAAGSGRQLYDFTSSGLELVSVLPNGTAATEMSGSGAGDANGNEHGHISNAVSDDGSRIYWTNSANSGGEGTIYVRLNGTTTKPVSGTVSAAKAHYETAATDGSKALFELSQGSSSGKQDLYLFDLASESSSLVAANTWGVMGASDDLSRVYFISPEVLDGGATSGKNNVYLYENGDTRFVTTLAQVDTAGEGFPGYDPTERYGPLTHASRVSADGRVVAFQSEGDLTDYDNTNTPTGEPTLEVYVYDADADVLRCVSCRASGARPVGAELQRPYAAKEDEPITNNGGPKRVWTAAWLTTARHITHIPRILSDDGNRLFFNAFDALVPQDTNGQQDVYEWEAQGTGGCTKPEGCLSLISSGTSAKKSEFIDASPDGRDVFFATESSLVPQDPGLIDIYDARAGGGYPPPPPPPPPCVGDACQHVPSAPNQVDPASATFRGAGSPVARSARNCGARARQAAKLSRRAKGLRRRARHVGSTRRAKLLRHRSARLAKRAKGLSKRATRCRRAKRGAKR